MLGASLALALLLVVPGLLFLVALRGRPRGLEEGMEDLGHALALSVGILVIVGTVLGYAGWYRFGATGAPVVEAVLLAFTAAAGAIALRRLGPRPLAARDGRRDAR